MPHRPLGVDEIDRKYEVLEKLGEGGMGAIFKVRHRLLDELRVIKLIRSELEGRDELQARFLREAKVATQLRHPNIAQMFDFSVGEDGTAYIVMEFIDGRNLAEVLDDVGKLPLGAAVEIATQCLEALAYLHEKHLIHRDIAPDNIMIVRDERGGIGVKLIDLGIAKPLEATQAHTQAGAFVGKVKYAAPEAFSGSPDRPVEERSDLYSLGLVLYETLTGHFAITGTDQASVMAGHLFAPPRSFEETDPDGEVPAAVRAVILKSLEKVADDRFSSAEEFLGALREVTGDTAAGLGEEPFEAVTVLSTELPAPGAAAESAAGKTELVGRRAAHGGWFGRLRSVEPRRLLRPVLIVVAVGATAFGVWWAAGTGRAPDRSTPGAAAGGSARSGDPGSRAVALTDLDYGTYHALVIGNNAYEQLPPLKTAAVDAADLAEMLESKYGFRVTLLTDASRYQIITALTEVTSSLTANDNLLIYYAGHGWLDGKNQTGYWQPVDAEPFSNANWISTKYEVSAVLADVPARQVLVVADSCYSGVLSEDIEPAASIDRSAAEYADHVRELLVRRSRLALTSGGLSPVLDVGDGRHSVFSKVLLEILGANSGVLETSRIFGDLKSRVAAAAARFGAEQDPRLAPIPQIGDEGGEFFFVPASTSG